MTDPALHRHKNLKGQWVTGVADGAHKHPEIADMQKQIADLKLRVEFLELIICPPVKK